MVETFDHAMEPEGSSSNMLSKWSGKEKGGGVGKNSKSFNA